MCVMIVAERKGQRREPAVDGVRFVFERIGWLPFAGLSWADKIDTPDSSFVTFVAEIRTSENSDPSKHTSRMFALCVDSYCPTSV